jgi:hypothetical protein
MVKVLVSNYVKSLLDSNVTELVRNNEEFVFNKHDLWAGPAGDDNGWLNIG